MAPQTPPSAEWREPCALASSKHVVGSSYKLYSNERLFAISNICSHANEKLECGRMSRSWIACPVHGARFDLATGRAMNPPAKLPIATYEVRVVEDWIEVRV